VQVPLAVLDVTSQLRLKASGMTKLNSTQALFDHFDALGLSHKTLEHRAVFTVEEGADIKATMPGGHTKNLFLKDKDGALFLVCALGTTPIRLNQLHKTLDCARLSFGSEALMGEVLGVTPGSVTLFALINDPAARVTLVLDSQLLAQDLVNFHPLRNTATTAMPTQDVLKFVKNWGGRVFSCDFMGEVPVARRLNLAG
jgi:Ala-tRNA(Pro) deacylase